MRYDQQGARESGASAYDTRWLATIDRFAVEPSLPLVAGPRFHRRAREGSVFHAAIADTEPDGWGRHVIQRDHAKPRQEARRAGEAVYPRPSNAMDYLLAVDDVSRVGALRFQDEEGPTSVPSHDTATHLSASRAIETKADLADLRGRGTSLGGLRPKYSMLDEDGEGIGRPPEANQRGSASAVAT